MNPNKLKENEAFEEFVVKRLSQLALKVAMEYELTGRGDIVQT